jgi:hypothetical protein
MEDRKRENAIKMAKCCDEETSDARIKATLNIIKILKHRFLRVKLRF